MPRTPNGWPDRGTFGGERDWRLGHPTVGVHDRVLAKALDPAKTTVSEIMTKSPQCVPPDMKVADAVLIMIERGFRHLPVVTAQGKILGVFSVRDTLPRELSAAMSMAEFNEQVNDALG